MFPHLEIFLYKLVVLVYPNSCGRRTLNPNTARHSAGAGAGCQAMFDNVPTRRKVNTKIQNMHYMHT